MAEISTQVRLCGFGGQGVILAGTILGYAGINDEKWVASSSSYGSAARGGSCRSDVIISDKPIRFPHVIAADILIALSQKAYDIYLKNIRPQGGIVIYDEQMVAVAETSGVKQIGVAATSAAMKEFNSKQVANIIILSAAVAITGIVGRDALMAAIEENVPQKFRDLNLKAVGLGLNLGSAVKGRK
ncbi:2-oxoacid:acceptor oxidoreductase family protein [Chloroflexota bacterium]